MNAPCLRCDRDEATQSGDWLYCDECYQDVCNEDEEAARIQGWEDEKDGE